MQVSSPRRNLLQPTLVRYYPSLLLKLTLIIGPGAASISSQPKKSTTLSKFISVKGSGRTSLSAQMSESTPDEDDDWEIMEIAGPSQPKKQPVTASRFFGAPSTPRKSRPTSSTTPERKRKRADSVEEIATPRAARTLVRRWSGELVDMTEEKENKGLRTGTSTGTSRSGSPDTFSLLQDLSSPVQPDSVPSRSRSPDWIENDLSSPMSTRKLIARPPLQLGRSLGIIDLEAGLDQDMPTPVPLLTFKKTTTPPRNDTIKRIPSRTSVERRQTVTVDLKEVFSQESVSDIGTFEDGPWTPSDQPAPIAQVATNDSGTHLDDAEYISDEEEHEAEIAKRQAKVAQGWALKYGCQAIKGRKVCLICALYLHSSLSNHLNSLCHRYLLLRLSQYLLLRLVRSPQCGRLQSFSLLECLKVDPKRKVVNQNQLRYGP